MCGGEGKCVEGMGYVWRGGRCVEGVEDVCILLRCLCILISTDRMNDLVERCMWRGGRCVGRCVEEVGDVRILLSCLYILISTDKVDELVER
jgi:hypothetical protein